MPHHRLNASNTQGVALDWRHGEADGFCLCWVARWGSCAVRFKILRPIRRLGQIKAGMSVTVLDQLSLCLGIRPGQVQRLDIKS